MALPASYLSTYKSYKTGTAKIVTWLVENAQLCGADMSFLATTAGAEDGAAKKTNPSKYSVPIKEFINLAKTIASATNPKVRIPKHIVTLVRGVIVLRKDASRSIAHFSRKKTGTATLAAKKGHSHFVSVLESVLEILQPATSATTQDDGDGTDALENMYSALTIEETTSEGSSPARSPTKLPEDQYQIGDSDADEFFALISFVKDMNDIRAHLKHVWCDYQRGKLDLMSAAITTDTAFSMMRLNSRELIEAYPGRGQYTELVKFLTEYMDDIGGATAGFEEWLCSITFEKLRPFAECLIPNMVLSWEPPQSGGYDPKRDRSLMSKAEQGVEDLALVMEVLPEFTKVSRFGMDVPAEDELTKGFRHMIDASNLDALPLYAVFAWQVFFDIHHILRNDASRPFQEMQTTGKKIVDTLDDYFRFSRGRRIDTWPAENDELLRQFRTLANDWTQTDIVANIASTYETRSISRIPHLFLKRHPVLCGLLTYRMNTQMQEYGITLCNAWGSVIYPAHFYNAARQSASLESDWKDMDYIISLHSPQRIFVGAAPTQAEEYLKRFLLALGVSATHFARNRRAGGSSLIVQSKKGPRGLKTTTPVKDVFHDRYISGETAKLSTANLVAMLSVAAKAKCNIDSSTDLQVLARDLTKQKQRQQLQLLDIVREGIAGEEIHLLFDYFGLHQRSWKMLRTLQTHLHADLVKYFGEMYVEEESQLPYVIGYLFEVVWGSDRIMEALRVEGRSRMLQTAAGVLDRFLEDEENSAKSTSAANASTTAVPR